jgi:hypothetical protein
MRDQARAKTSQSSRPGEIAIRPEWGFAAATVAGFSAWAAASAILSQDAVMPLVASVFLGLAALFGLAAWRIRPADPARVTHRDVAGALTLIGICAAATIEPEQMVRLVEAAPAAERR